MELFNRSGAYRVTTVSIFLLSLTGCIPVDFIRGIFRPVGNHEIAGANSDRLYHVEIQSLHIPARGEQVVIVDPRSNKEITVTFGEVYPSASGTLCSYFTFEDRGANVPGSGLACMNGEKKWSGRMLDLNIYNTPQQ